jgi:uncharacterized protein (DUF1015 family)
LVFFVGELLAHIRPFAGIHYARRDDLDLSRLIAPPYDVLDEKGKAALQARHPNNIVTIDLPHLPAKSAGPDDVYERANMTLQSWLSSGILVQDPRPALYPYMQTYTHAGRTFHRRGFIALVKLSPFGQGEVVPHEKTYKGPIEDRLKLMRATGIQLSPIFGLFSDPRNEVTNLLYRNVGKPMLSGTMDDVKNDLWAVPQAEIENQVIDLMKHKPVYIADGHHRYTTALQYQAEAAQACGGTLPASHPANYCMFVLISMQDDGLLILPTHRMIGGLANFSVDALTKVLGADWEVQQSAVNPSQLDDFARMLAGDAPGTFGLYDGATKNVYTLKLKKPDILKAYEPNQSEAWRSLDVAILQRYLLDEVLQPRFGTGVELTKGYTPEAGAIPAQVDGIKYQLAVILRPTPLHALEELGRHGEVMPQKSTYFFPKLATGMVMNPLK